MKRIILTLISTLISIFCLAQNSSSFYIDQDWFNVFGRRADEDYTMGIGVKYQSPKLFDSGLSNVIWKVDDKLSNLLTSRNALIQDSIRVGYWMLNGNGFTPTKLNTTEIQIDDRPYSSLIVVSFGTSKVIERENRKLRHKTIELTIGVLGTGASAALQTGIHWGMRDTGINKNKEIPIGWENQISNGGEPTAMLAIKNKKLIKRSPGISSLGISEGRFYDLTFGNQLFAGYYTGGALTFGARIGLLNPDNWVISAAPLNNVQSLFNNEKKPKKKHWEFYYSTELNQTLMIYNALLQGQFRESVYTIRADKLNPLFYTFTNAINLTLPCRKSDSNFNLSYNFYTHRSSEFRKSDYKNSGGHNWGGIYLTFTNYR